MLLEATIAIRPDVIYPARHDEAIRCYHVDARLSKGIDDIGRARKGKILLILRYSVEAVWCRLRYGRSACITLSRLVCDGDLPAFLPQTDSPYPRRRTRFVARRRGRPGERFISRRLLGHADLNIALNEYYRVEVPLETALRSWVTKSNSPLGTCAR